ncbi:MAG: iron-sulfur cluster assembly scaffold protein [Terriglobales bacterium]
MAQAPSTVFVGGGCATILVSYMYPPELLDHFQHPRNAGAMESPDVSVQAENPACGDVMKLMLRISDGRIAEAKYQVRGCVASIACGSALTEVIAGKSVPEAAMVRRESLVEKLGGLANESMHASHLAIDCLKLALRQLTN